MGGELIFSDSFLDVVHAHDSGVVLIFFSNLISIRARAGMGHKRPSGGHAIMVK